MRIVELSAVQSPESRSSDASSRKGLDALAEVTLNDRCAQMLEMASRYAFGDAAWQGRMRAEARDLLALSQVAPPGRLHIEWIDMFRDLRVLLHLRVPVARRPDRDNRLNIAERVVLGLTYRREAVHVPLPGTAFFDVLQPQDAWHANVGPLPRHPTPVLCLGAELPAGTRTADLVLMAYGAFSMQSVQIDEQDTAGVLSVEAARWWQQNMHRVPLSATPFLQSEPEREGTAQPKTGPEATEE